MFKKKFHNSIDKGRYGYLFIAPFFIVFAVFGLYPIVYTFILSFQKWDGLAKMTPLGWKNYARLLTDDVFYLSIWNTIRIWIFNFVPQMLTALLLSALFTFNRIRGMKFFRAAYYLPNLITAASVGLLFNLLFDGNKSVANYILQALHVKGAPFSFFNSGAFTSGMTSYIQWWMWFGYTTVIVMAGITTIEGSVYDAAMVDGATKAQTFTKITLPLIRPTLIYMTITSIIGGMQLFDVPTTLTNGTGDPNKSVLTTSMYLYNQGFKNFNYGYTENRKTAHDFRAHLDMLSSLLENGETTEASRYLNNIRTKQTTRIFLVNCHHPVLDALLNQKARLAQEKRIDIRFKVNDLSALTIDPTDITVILSNLLDNAIEASEKCDNKQIEVRVLLENSFFFSIRNTSLPVHIINNHITSTKSDRSLHGFGLENVKTLLVKHNGEYVMFYDNGWFQFSAEIPTEFIS